MTNYYATTMGELKAKTPSRYISVGLLLPAGNRCLAKDVFALMFEKVNNKKAQGINPEPVAQ